MFDPMFAAGEPNTTPTWLAMVLAVGGTFVGTLGAVVIAKINKKEDRLIKSEDRNAEDRKNSVAGQAAVEVERLKVDASERERVFAAWQANEKKYADEALSIRKEMLQMRKTFGHEIRHLQQFIFNLQDFYHLLHNAATLLDMQNRIMSAELKAMLGEKFDEAKFPHIDLSLYDPKKMPRFSPLNSWDDNENGEKKMTASILLTPNLTRP